MSDQYTGEIRAFGFQFAPINYGYCNGALLSIQQNAALFSLLGTAYGGDGRVSFQLPDLQGRMPMGQGSGAGLTSRTLGQMLGMENTYLIGSQCAVEPHIHPATMNMGALNATTDIKVSSTTPNDDPNLATAPDADGATLSNSPSGTGFAGKIYLKSGTAQNTPVSLGGVSTSVTGSGSVTVELNAPASATAPVELINPSTVINFCIALQGLYPQRN